MGPKGFQPLGIAAASEHIPLLPQFIRQFGLTFPVGFTEGDLARGYLQISAMQQMYVPHIVFIDRQGMIREQHVGDDLFKDEETNIRKKVLELLSAPPLTTAKKAVAGK